MADDTKKPSYDKNGKDTLGRTKEDTDFLSEAIELFNVVVAAESESRRNMVDDQKFFAGSPDNFWQWPDKIRNVREKEQQGVRPCLTINKLPHHVRQVTNDQRQNKIGIHVVAIDDQADTEVAVALEGMIRHIEYNSDADIAYSTANETQVVCGVGYIRILTDYVAEDSFLQELKIQRVVNPLSVYMDPGAHQPDGSDAQYCFITELIPKADFENEYPDASADTEWAYVGAGDRTLWWEQERVRVCEMYRFEAVYTKLKLWKDGSTTFGDKDDKTGEKPVRERDVCRKQLCWYKFTGSQILDSRELPGKFIPVARVIGNEHCVEGITQYTGLVRNAKDAQRMYNYWCSQEAEILALAPKAPFVGAQGQFEGFEDDWKRANTLNLAYLQYNPISEGGTLVPPPMRQQPTMPPAGILQAKVGADNDIKATSGQWGPALGEPSNETSGRAIGLRQHESDTGSFHYLDNLSRGIRHVGRILLDLIPHVYDTRRTQRTIDDQGQEDYFVLDTKQEQANAPVQHPISGEAVGASYNPSIGRYDIAIIVGPSFTTKRQEALQAMNEMTQAQPQLWGVIGDLLVKNMDWPGANQMAERLKATLIPPVQKVVAKENLPPGVPPPPDPPPPPQVQLELQEKEAQVHKLQLDNMSKMRELQGGQPTSDNPLATEIMRTQSAEKIAAAQEETKRYVADEDRKSKERIEMAKLDQKHTKDLADAVHNANSLMTEHAARAKEHKDEMAMRHHEALSGVVSQLAKTVETLNKPKQLKLQRGADGSLQGATSSVGE